jgi:gliding motility-associated-like protein
MHPFPQGNLLALDDVKILSEGQLDFRDTVVCPGSTYRFHDPYDMNFQARRPGTVEVVDSLIMPNAVVELEIFLPECGIVDTIEIFPDACEDCFPALSDIDLCILDSISMDTLLADDTEIVIDDVAYQSTDVFRPNKDTSYLGIYRSAYCDTIALVEIEIGSCASCSPSFPDIEICPGDGFALAPYQPYDVSIDGSPVVADTFIGESGVYSILLSTAVCDTVSSFELEVLDCADCSDFTDTLPRVQCLGEVFTLAPFEGYDVYFEGQLLNQDTLLDDAGTFGIVLGSDLCDTLASFSLTVDSCQNCIPALELDEVEICINEGIPTDVFANEEIFWIDPPEVNCPGLYTLYAGHESCEFWIDSVTVVVSAQKECYTYQLNDSLCEGEPVVFDVDSTLGVAFLDQEPFSGGYVQRLVFQDVNCPQTSFEEAVTIFECKECRYAIPNIFSPNGDGVNDFFSMSVNCSVMDFEADIYDRWGNLLHRSRDPHRIWNGGNASIGTYVYRIQMQLFNGRSLESISETGTLTLVR